MNLEELLGVELPIIQAPMAGAQDSKLTISVSNAGGLGSLPCAMLDPDTMRKEVEAIRSHTERPYNLNFFAHNTPAHDEIAEKQWSRHLSPYYAELDITPDEIPAGATRKPFNENALSIVQEFKPAVVSFHFGLPSSDLLEEIHRAGSKIIATATTVAEAVWLEKQGIDAIIAQGIEAGGHRGMFLTEDLNSQVGTFALLPQVVNSVNVPVIAAGGIADSHGVNAAMNLGAAGVQIGTSYLLCPEATTSSVHRAALKSKEAQHTVLTNVFSGRPARGIVNRLIKELGPISRIAPQFPLATSAITPLRSTAEKMGSGDFSPLWAGQNTKGCREVSAYELTRSFFAK